MLGLCFYVEARVSCGRQINIERWESLARSFGVTDLIVIDQTGFECFNPKASIPVRVFSNLRDVLTMFMEANHVFVEKDSPVKPMGLYEFDHPDEDVIYFVGSDTAGFRGQTTTSGSWVYIPTQSKYSLWAEQAALLVLADRCRAWQ